MALIAFLIAAAVCFGGSFYVSAVEPEVTKVLPTAASLAVLVLALLGLTQQRDEQFASFVRRLVETRVATTPLRVAVFCGGCVIIVGLVVKFVFRSVSEMRVTCGSAASVEYRNWLRFSQEKSCKDVTGVNLQSWQPAGTKYFVATVVCRETNDRASRPETNVGGLVCPRHCDLAAESSSEDSATRVRRFIERAFLERKDYDGVAICAPLLAQIEPAGQSYFVLPYIAFAQDAIGQPTTAVGTLHVLEFALQANRQPLDAPANLLLLKQNMDRCLRDIKSGDVLSAATRVRNLTDERYLATTRARVVEAIPPLKGDFNE